MIHGLTEANLGQPDHDLALSQHAAYIETLESCGLEVTVLPADEAYPDSTFVEDVALLTPHCAIITRPGASSRRGEIQSMKPVLSQFFTSMEEIKAPGTVDAGDIMMVGDHYYIGLSQRTNPEGAAQMISLLEGYGMSGSTIYLEQVLHLKTGIAFLENNNLAVCGEFVAKSEFEKFFQIVVPESEAYAANCIWVNDRVIIPSGFPRTKDLISAAGYNLIETNMSEFQKLDGGLSCLSLRF
jgi:dimethylargininase